MYYKEEHKQDNIQTEKFQSNNEICDMCHGSGSNGDGTCSSCNGTGII